MTITSGRLAAAAGRRHVGNALVPSGLYNSGIAAQPRGSDLGGVRLASTTPVGDAKPNKKQRVVVLGSGWAGYGFARMLDPKKFERIVISPRSYFVFTPLLAGTAVGTLEFRAVLESVRRLGLDKFHQGWADDIDFARKTIRVEANTSDDLASRTQTTAVTSSDLQGREGDMFDVAYDKLIIAVGSYAQTFGIEGVKEYANFLRDIGDARKIRLKVLQCFEKAALPTTSKADRKKLLHFAVVGGGPTGIEFAAELHDLIRDDIRNLYPELMESVAITVYDIAPKVLPMFDQTLANYAMETFRREGIAVKTEHHLTRIRRDESCEGCLTLNIKEYGNKEVHAGIVVWSTGLMQNPLIQKMGDKAFSPSDFEGQGDQPPVKVKLQRDWQTGSVLTDSHLQVRVVPNETRADQVLTTESTALPDVYAIGDCSIIHGLSLPATAQVASQKATHLAKRLNQGDVDMSQTDDLKGWAAWVLWRTAYLTKSMSVRNKIMVPVYWAMSWLFGRDIARF
ncbi:pyridine nucleotide-disulfide oxidoreductase-domain-containing protein [Pseudomassariella vexata]|uniref:Pyridine nucleotide-disulfide oxidoreductase-domain-containing protein n=1 Tax=Pseudomassariella vexata TaxID=1141098 RepID=A0A1Y2EEQ4_9PEZI|nr:pyridine nucleotide-disulfide oxidoreductase-domain-containing protein [Pseudomassariella vexata]ORY69887.1 pyridine nucleotide-disulfide oxidoreductase-domain-containing protein [Pseudomassariella vexata]